MKKILIAIIVFLTILIIIQNIYYNNEKNNNISPNIVSQLGENQVEPKKVEESLYIVGMLKLYEDYSPKMDISTLQHKLYELVFENIPQIYNEIKDKTDEEIKNYYSLEKEKINLMNITNEEDFYIIAKQIKNILDDDVSLERSEFDESISYENNIINFKIILIYDNEKEMKINVKMSEITDMIQFSNATELDEIFRIYTGNVTKLETLKKIETFISSIKDLRLDSTLKTENERRQYFDLNKEKLESIGITSQDDYVKIAIQINAMRWREEDLQFKSYKVNTVNITNEEDYTSFEMIIYYNYDSSLDLKVSLSNQTSITPNIKISSYNI